MGVREREDDQDYRTRVTWNLGWIVLGHSCHSRSTAGSLAEDSLHS